jgi:hypothetical protein
MTTRALLAGAVALALVGTLALAGCGGSSPSLSRLRAQASRVCTRALTQTARIHPPPVPAATAAFLRGGIRVLSAELAALRTVRAPSEQAGAYSTALSSLARELAILSATARALDRGADPLTSMKTLQHRLAPVEADDAAAWHTLGVPACVDR